MNKRDRARWAAAHKRRVEKDKGKAYWVTKPSQRIVVTKRRRPKKVPPGARLSYFPSLRMYHVEQGGMIDPDALIRLLIEEGRGRGDYRVIAHNVTAHNPLPSDQWLTFGRPGCEPRP